MRISWDQVKRQQLDTIHSLEEIVRNEREMRQQWSEKFEKETRLLSMTNVELMDVKKKFAEILIKYKHIDIEFQNEKKLNENIINSKKEMMDTLNKYIIKCENIEKELYAISEVNKHFEHLKQQEFKDLK